MKYMLQISQIKANRVMFLFFAGTTGREENIGSWQNAFQKGLAGIIYQHIAQVEGLQVIAYVL